FEELQRVVAMVDAVNVNVINIQQQIAIGFSDNSIDEFDFAHLLLGCAVVGCVFDGDALFQNVLRLANSRSYITDGFFGEGYWQQIIKLASIAAVTQVLAVIMNTVAP